MLTIVPSMPTTINARHSTPSTTQRRELSESAPAGGSSRSIADAAMSTLLVRAATRRDHLASLTEPCEGDRLSAARAVALQAWTEATPSYVAKSAGPVVSRTRIVMPPGVVVVSV